MQNKNMTKMGETPMFKLIMQMSLPAMLSMIVYALYNVVDTIFVSRISNDAINALSLAFPIQMLIISVAVGTGAGINSYVSRKLGEKSLAEANNAATHGIILGLISSAVFMILGFTIVEPFFSMYTNNPIVHEMGVQYLSINLIFAFGICIEVNIEKTIQATGNMILPMVMMIVGGVTNIILDPLLIFGIGFFPEMGVAGAGVATVSGQILSLIVGIVIVLKAKLSVKFSFKKFKFNLVTVKNIYAVGFPAIIMQSIGTIMMLGMNAILITFSETAVGVLGIYYKLQSFIIMPVLGINQGIMPIMGYNFGARNKERLLKALKIGILIAFVIMVVGTLSFSIFAKELLLMFEADEDMLEIGVGAFRTICWNFLPASVIIVMIAYFQAIGRGVKSMIISILRQLGVLLPVAYLLSFISLDSVWWSFLIAEVVALILAVIFFKGTLKRDISKL